MIFDRPAQEQIAQDLQEEGERLAFYQQWAYWFTREHDADWLDIQLEEFLEANGMLPLGEDPCISISPS